MATNRPWDLDSAVLSRLGVKLFVDTLDDTGRTELCKKFIEQYTEKIMKYINIEGDWKDFLRDIAPKFNLDEFASIFMKSTSVDDTSLLLDYNFSKVIKKDISAEEFQILTGEDLPQENESKIKSILSEKWKENGNFRTSVSNSPEKSKILLKKGNFIFGDWAGNKNLFNEKNENYITGAPFGYSNRDLASIFNQYLGYCFDEFQNKFLSQSSESEKKQKYFKNVLKENSNLLWIFTSGADYSYEEIENDGTLDRIINFIPLDNDFKGTLIKAIQSVPSSVKSDEYIELHYYHKFGERI
jgi:SpoVK/Ycf46/Vps4 family AAA+-type ATPase